MLQESPSLRGGPTWCGALWVCSGAFSALAPWAVRAQGHLATPHPHHCPGRSPVHPPQPPGTARPPRLSSPSGAGTGGTDDCPAWAYWGSEGGAGTGWGAGQGAHLGQGQADGACATAHVQHRAARVQLGPVPDERVEHLSCGGVHLGAAGPSEQPRPTPSLPPTSASLGALRLLQPLCLLAQEHSSVLPPPTSS